MKWPEKKSTGHFDFYPKPDTVWNWMTDPVRQAVFFNWLTKTREV